MTIQRFISFSILYLCMANASIAQEITVKVFDNNHKLLPGVVVYLEPSQGMVVPTSSEMIEISQIDKSFSPYLGVIQKGTKVKFHNLDDISHHIYSPIGNNKFAFKISAGEEHIKSDFIHTGTITMGCNIHDWMSGHLLILDTPYFAKTNDQGEAKIEVAQQGKYTVVVWHPQMQANNQRINKSINSAQETVIEMALLKALNELPSQKSDDDFDFLSDY